MDYLRGLISAMHQASYNEAGGGGAGRTGGQGQEYPDGYLGKDAFQDPLDQNYDQSIRNAHEIVNILFSQLTSNQVEEVKEILHDELGKTDLDLAYIAGVILTYTSTTSSAVEYSKIGEAWLSKIGWRSGELGANGATGPKVGALTISNIAKSIGRIVFGLSAVLSANKMKGAIKNKDTQSAIGHGFDISMGAYGLTGVGTIPAVLYFSVELTIGWKPAGQSYQRVWDTNILWDPGWNSGPKW